MYHYPVQKNQLIGEDAHHHDEDDSKLEKLVNH